MWLLFLQLEYSWIAIKKRICYSSSNCSLVRRNSSTFIRLMLRSCQDTMSSIWRIFWKKIDPCILLVKRILWRLGALWLFALRGPQRLKDYGITTMLRTQASWELAFPIWSDCGISIAASIEATGDGDLVERHQCLCPRKRSPSRQCRIVYNPFCSSDTNN